MKLKNSFFYTIREDIKNEESTSGNLLVRSGMIKKVGVGTYMYLPMGLKVLKNIENLVRVEMNKKNAEEVLMPSLINQEIYEQSKRNETFGDSIFRLKDRYDKPYILGPTHEELFVLASKQKVKSYKDLGYTIYQFQNKFRDEPRPRYGLIRVREFIMKDAYSFDTNLETLDISYQKMFNAYKNIFDKLKLDYKIVKADTGAMGGLLSEEFQAVTEIGEDTLVLCEECNYASNIEIAKCIVNKENTNEEIKEIQKIKTPNKKTIKELSLFLNINENKLLKTLIYKVDNKLVAFLLNGNRELNETKVLKLLKGNKIEIATEEEIKNIANSKAGFIGPKNLNIPIVMDINLEHQKNLVIGSNEKDFHYINANINIDFKYDIKGDITNIKENDICPNCGKKIIFKKGIEVGNTFKLGTKYSEALNLNYSDENNKLKPVVMGSYGIGIGRTMAAIVEQNKDEKGIIWPLIIAPYKVIIVLINEKDEKQNEIAEIIYKNLNENNIETILDNRKERIGVKFNDADLIGIPIRITVGKKAKENIIEIKERKKENVKEIKYINVLNEVKEIINGEINE